MPQISIIVPVYKVENYLHKCLDSILAETLLHGAILFHLYPFARLIVIYLKRKQHNIV